MDIDAIDDVTDGLSDQKGLPGHIRLMNVDSQGAYYAIDAGRTDSDRRGYRLPLRRRAEVHGEGDQCARACYPLPGSKARHLIVAFHETPPWPISGLGGVSSSLDTLERSKSL